MIHVKTFFILLYLDTFSINCITSKFVTITNSIFFLKNHSFFTALNTREKMHTTECVQNLIIHREWLRSIWNLF